MVVSLTSAVSVTWHSVGIILRAATKSVVGDSTGREIREPQTSTMTQNKGNNKLILHYVTAQFIYVEKDNRIVRMIAYVVRMMPQVKDNKNNKRHKNA